jgi:predicted RNA-binding protein
MRSIEYQSAYNNQNINTSCENSMCELNVIINSKTVFKDVVHIKNVSKGVFAKNVLGETKEYENYVITEVDVNSSSIILTQKT